MNTKDIIDEEVIIPEDGNLLQAMFDRQRELMGAYHVIERENGLLLSDQVPIDLHDKLGQARIRELIRRVVEELFEASHTLKNSPWKVSHVLTDEDHFYEELSDAWHFFLELLITVGIDAEDLYRIYYKKAEVNSFRQRSKY